jgi:hypothetical protein
MNYNEWLNSVPADIKNDSLWKMEAYRLGLFASDLGWYDVTKLLADKRTIGLSSQLYEALGSISANISEGYSRGTGRGERNFTNMLSARPGRVAIGITKGGVFFQKK